MATQELIDNESDYSEALAYLGTQGEIYADTETTGTNPRRDRVVGVGVCAGERSFYFAFRHGEGANLPERLLRDLYSKVLPKDRPQIGHNYGYDIHIGQKDGHDVPDNWDCTESRQHLLEQDEPLKLESILERHIDPEAGSAEKELETLVRSRHGGTKKTWKSNLWRLPARQVYKYGTQDVISTRDLFEYQTDELANYGLTDYAEEIKEYIDAMLDIEMRGILIDTERLAGASERAQEEAQKWEKKILERAGDFAINDKFVRSPKQLNTWLGYGGTSKEILGLHTDDERARAVLEYRAWHRVQASYYKRLSEEVTANNRHHPNFRVPGTVSGRPSCYGLNWFAVPKGSADITAAMSGVKQLVIAPPGMVVVEFDFSQAEIRSLAHYMQQYDPSCILFDILETGECYHDRTAKETGLPRPVAKALNLSAQYGIGPAAFAKQYKYQLKAARDYLEAYHRAMPGVKPFTWAAADKAKTHGFVRIADGRIRRFTPPKDGGRPKYYTAANNLCQGMIAGRTRVAIVRARKEVPEFKQVLNVYDSMIGYLPEDNWREPASRIKAIMEEKIWTDIPFKASVSVGPNWYEAKEIEL